MLGFKAVSNSQQTREAYYKSFPALKHLFLCEAGSGTYEATDIVGGLKLLNKDWTSTGFFSSYMNVQTENSYIEENPVGHHNVVLPEGKWVVPGRQSSMWFLIGKFDGIFSFGFGDSTPNGQEIVFSQAGTNSVYAALTFQNGTTMNVPDVSSGEFTPSVLDSSVTSIVGVLINEEAQEFELFYTDANGDYQYATRPFTDYPITYPGCRFYPTYSMGRDVVTSGASGIVDLRAIAGLCFETLPSDYRTDLEWVRDQFAAGRKVFPESWNGLAGGEDAYEIPVPGDLSLVVDSSSQITVSHTGASDSSGIDRIDLWHGNNGATDYALLQSDATFPYVHSGLGAASDNYYFARVYNNNGADTITNVVYGQTDP